MTRRVWMRPQGSAAAADATHVHEAVSDDVEFWQRHVRVGLVLTVVVLLVTVPYHLATAATPQRLGLLSGLAGWATLVMLLVTVAPWRRLVRNGRARPLLIAWMVSSILSIDLGLLYIGGHASPLWGLVVLPIIWSATAFSARVLAALTTLAVVADALGGLAVGEPAGYEMLMRAVFIALVGWTCGWSARSYQRVTWQLRRSAVALEHLATFDGLTGCLNHRSFRELLEREVAAATVAGRRVSLLLLDLDDFKQINDTHGHLVGDDVLAATGTILRDSVRGADSVGRVGGEEFGIVLPDAESEVGRSIAERCRAALAAGDLVVPVTASFGVATLPDVAASAEELLAAADAALYGAKGAGRDRVLVTDRQDGADAA